jgi:small subunit ribosomal protein S13
MRLLGVNLPDSKSVKISLTYLFGVGLSRAKQICSDCNIDEKLKLGDLSQDQVQSIAHYIKNNFTIEGDLRKNVSVSIKHLMDIKCYRGIRHRKGLPVRGQRTNTNARTRKGKSKVPVAGKKKV